MNKHVAIRIGSIFIGLGLSMLLLVVGYRIIQSVFTQASDSAPRDVVVNNITANSATVTWTTDKETQGDVAYGLSADALNFRVPEVEQTSQHTIDLTLLSSSTPYFYAIEINGKAVEDGTFTTLGSDTDAAPIKGSPAPTSATRPASIQTLQIPDSGSSASTTSTCTETNCALIKARLGSGCTTQEYFQCIRALTPTP